MAALAVLRADPRWRVEGLLTTFNEVSGRVAMHATRKTLVETQARALDLPLIPVGLPETCPNEIYEQRLAQALEPYIGRGIRDVAIGDLFLDDIRAWREVQFKRLGLTPHFPIWGRDTAQLAADLIATGWRAVISCVDSEQLDPVFLGRQWDTALLDELPDGVDPCGENGEFHTFVFDGPLLAGPIVVRPGETRVTHGRFHMLDLVPA